MLQRFSLLLAAFAVGAELTTGNCEIDKNVLKFSTAANYTSRVTKILTGMCEKNGKSSELPCDQEIVHLVNLLGGYFQMYKGCSPKDESDGSHFLQSVKFSDIPYAFQSVGFSDFPDALISAYKRSESLNISSMASIQSDPYSCGSQCASWAVTQCTLYCYYAISLCLEGNPKCPKYAMQCFYDMPVCCTCGAYYHDYTCSLCGY